MRRIAIAVVVVAAALLATAQESSTSEVFDEAASGKPWEQSPSSFRGISFGSTEAAAITVLGPMKCHDLGLPWFVRECRAIKNESRMKINGTAIEDFYQFHEGKLVSVRLSDQTSAMGSLPSPAFRDVVSAFTERYGPPTRTWKTRHKGVQSAHYSLVGRPLGPWVPYEFITEAAEWKGDEMVLTLAQRNDGSFGWGSLQTAAWVKEHEALTKKPTTAF